MKNLQIEIPDGYKVESFDESTGKIKFQPIPKSVTERIKTVDDLLTAHGLTINKIDEMFESVSDHLKFQYIAELLCETLNEGWEPDWSDSNQYKYFPWFEMCGASGFLFDDYGGWDAFSGVGSRLCLRSRKLAKYAGEQFTDIYKKFMITNN